SFGFTVSGERRCTRPRTRITYSERSAPAFSWQARSVSGLNTICTSPSRSRRSTKITPPWSRRRCTQPPSTTSSPTRWAVISPARCVRRRPDWVSRPPVAELTRFLRSRGRRRVPDGSEITAGALLPSAGDYRHHVGRCAGRSRHLRDRGVDVVVIEAQRAANNGVQAGSAGGVSELEDLGLAELRAERVEPA